MRREGLRAESKDITPRSVKMREALLWSKGLGVGNWQTKTFLSLGIMIVRFPGLNWHRRAKVPLQSQSCPDPIFLKRFAVRSPPKLNKIRYSLDPVESNAHFCFRPYTFNNQFDKSCFN